MRSCMCVFLKHALTYGKVYAQKFIPRLFWVGILVVHAVRCLNIKACIIYAPTSPYDDDNLGDLLGRKRVGFDYILPKIF